MKSLFFAILLSLGLSTIASADEQAEFESQAKAAVKEFEVTLKSALLSAMKEEGPVGAIAVCQQTAPIIAQQLSTKYKLEVSRTSLKVRNPNNAPDEWEQSVLVNFESRLKAGEALNKLSFTEQVSDQTQPRWRMMKAIPTGKICLTCHGAKIAAPVKAKLDQLYVNDQARGFKLGDIRGAFSISSQVTQP